MEDLEEELQQLDQQMKQLKLDYEQYFLGSRPREPRQLRDQVDKQVQRRIGTAIRNTALRFRFNSMNSRFQALKRQWDHTLRQIESGTYERHVFKANLRDASAAPARCAPPACSRVETLFEAYRAAAAQCGQDTKELTREALARAVEKQRAAAERQLGSDQLAFDVAIDAGRVKIKVSRARA